MPLVKRSEGTLAGVDPQIEELAGALHADVKITTGTTSTPTPEQLGLVAAVKSAVKKATANDTMSKADWHDKDVRISRQGLFQACLQSVGLLQLNTGNTFDDYMKLVEQAAERGLEFVNRGA